MSSADEQVPAHIELLETVARCATCDRVAFRSCSRTGPAVSDPLTVTEGAFMQRLDAAGKPEGPWYPVCASCVRSGQVDELAEGVAECLSST